MEGHQCKETALKGREKKKWGTNMPITEALHWSTREGGGIKILMYVHPKMGKRLYKATGMGFCQKKKLFVKKNSRSQTREKSIARALRRGK